MIFNDIKLRKFIIGTVVVFLLFVFSFIFINAEPVNSGVVLNGLDLAAEKGGIKSDVDDPAKIIGRLINAFLGILGILALVRTIYGGFLIMTGSSGGKEDKINKGKDVLKWSLIGLIIIFASYAIVNFVIDKVLTATGVS